MPDYGDPYGGMPPLDTASDLASLQYPWSDPPSDPALAGEPAAPPPVDAQLAGAPNAPEPLTPDVLAPPPPAATVAAMPDITIRPEQTLDSPDALTGAAPLPGTPEAAQAAMFGDAAHLVTPEQHYQQTAQQYAGDPLAIPDPGERQRAMGSLDPYQLAEANARDKERRDAFIADRRKAYADADAEAARQHLADLHAANAVTQAKMEETLAAAQKIADTKIDPTGGVHGSRRFAGILGAIIGGLVQGKTGAARNFALDAYTDTVNAGIEAQKAELANKKGAIDLKRNVLAAEFARTGDMFQAEETVRLASWRHIDDLLAFEQQNYDPRGRTALLIANQRQQIGGAIQQAQDTARQKFFDNHIKLQNAAREQQLADSTVWHNKAQIGLGYANLANDAANRKEARDARYADKEAERADKEAERDRQFAIGGVPHLQVDDKGKPALGPDGKPVVSYDDLRNSDGKGWRAASPEETTKLREKLTAASQLTKLYDRVLAIRDRSGGASKWANSDDYQELKGLEKEILLLKKQGTQGMSSDADMENLSGAAGAEDVTSFRARAAGLKAARARTVDGINETFRKARYTGPALAFPEPEPAKNTPDEDRKQALLQKPNESLDDVVKREIDARTAGRGYGLDLNDPADRALYHDALSAGQAKYDPGASVDQRSNIDALAQQVASGGEGADEARKVLQTIAKDANTAKLQSLAKEALDAIERSKRPAPRGPASQGVTVPDELKLPAPEVP